MNLKRFYFLSISISLWAALVGLLFSGTAFSAQRVALVIGNGAYQNAPLSNPVNDALDMAKTLKSLGFDVINKTNANKATMLKAIDQFGEKLRRSKVGLFYYAGHGLQVKGSNYLVPVGAYVTSETDVEYEGVNAGRILGKMETAGNTTNIIILDACRNNPFKRSFRSASRGLARMDAPRGTFIAYSTSPGSVAADGKGRNGVFTKYLLRNMVVPELPIETVLKRVRKGVLRATHQAQMPWQSSSLTGDFYFASSGAVWDTPVSPKETAGKAYLSVESNISGADVMVDGQTVGHTNLSDMSISSGKHRIAVDKEGYETYRKTIQIKKGRSVSLYVDLNRIAPKNGSLYINPEPTDATVKILNIGPVFYQGMELSAGRYQVEVSKNGYETKSMWISLNAGEDKRLDIHLQQMVTTVGSQGQNWTDPVTGMEFVWVPKGCFQMGSNSSGQRDEKPVHKVCLDGFWIGKYEVTINQFRKFAKATGYQTDAQKAGWSWSWNGTQWEKKNGIYWDNPGMHQQGDHPVIHVSWNDAKAMAKWMSHPGQYLIGLPSEAQWEYAARSGGKNETYSGSNHIDQVAWYNVNSGGKTHSVGTKSPNGLGIYDMSGNIWEWCEDIYSDSAYGQHSRNNPIYTGSGSYRVSRGGSWGFTAQHCRAAFRLRSDPGYRGDIIGFRLLRK